MKWTRYFLSYCSLVSMFLSLAKCFLLLGAVLAVACSPHLRLKWHLVFWHCTETYCFTGDCGTTLTRNNGVRLCEKRIYDPPSSSCEVYHCSGLTIIQRNIWRNQQNLHSKSHTRAKHCQSRKKLLSWHLLRFFVSLCHAFSPSSLQGLKNIFHLVFLLWAQCQRAHLISVQGHPRRPALRLNASPRRSTFDELCFSLRVFFPPYNKIAITNWCDWWYPLRGSKSCEDKQFGMDGSRSVLGWSQTVK